MQSVVEELDLQVRQLVSELSESAARYDNTLHLKDDEIYDLRKKLGAANEEIKQLRHFESNHSNHVAEDAVQKERKKLLSAMDDLKSSYEEKLSLLQESYTFSMIALQDYLFLEYDGEESMKEYFRLYSLYGEYVGAGEEKLLEFWLLIGGTDGWQDTLRPSQIRLLFSRDEETTHLRYRIKNENLPVRGGTLIPEAEVTGFFSVLIPRLPHLEYFALYECSINPFDWSLIGDVRLSYQPFPSLKGLDIRFTQALDTDLVHLVDCAPLLEPYSGEYKSCEEKHTYFFDGLWIDDWCITYSKWDRDTVERNCGSKLLIVC